MIDLKEKNGEGSFEERKKTYRERGWSVTLVTNLQLSRVVWFSRVLWRKIQKKDIKCQTRDKKKDKSTMTIEVTLNHKRTYKAKNSIDKNTRIMNNIIKKNHEKEIITIKRLITNTFTRHK